MLARVKLKLKIFSDKAADKAKEVNENVDKAAEKVADKARRCEIIKHKKSTSQYNERFFYAIYSITLHQTLNTL